jgi:mannose-6-phosphate isomerase-like protein (cupin superfamily)
MFLRATETTPFEWCGLAISDHTAALELSSSVATIDVPPGVRHPRAWSDRSDKYYVVVEGRVHFDVGGESSELGPADVCIVRRGERFEYANRTSRTVRLTLVHTPPFDPDTERLEE